MIDGLLLLYLGILSYLYNHRDILQILVWVFIPDMMLLTGRGKTGVYGVRGRAKTIK